MHVGRVRLFRPSGMERCGLIPVPKLWQKRAREVMTFEELIGQELPFFGVDNHAFKIGDYVFEAIEDESDGYRSYLKSVEVKEIGDLIFFVTPIATVKITEETGASCDLYVFTDSEGYVWLTFGTNNTDDYYPYFTFEYKPQYPAETVAK